MAIAQVGSTTNATSNGVAITPTGAAAGNLLLYFVFGYGGGGATIVVSPPTVGGVTPTLLKSFGYNETIGGDYGTLFCYGVIPSSTPAATSTFTATSNDAGFGLDVLTICLSGAAATIGAAIDSGAGAPVANSGSPSGGTAISTGGLTTSNANEWVIWMIFGDHATWSTPAGMTALFGPGTSGHIGDQEGLSYVAQASAGASGSFSTTGSATDDWISILLAVVPASGGGGGGAGSMLAPVDLRDDPYPCADPARLFSGYVLPAAGSMLAPVDWRLDPYPVPASVGDRPTRLLRGVYGPAGPNSHVGEWDTGAVAAAWWDDVDVAGQPMAYWDEDLTVSPTLASGSMLAFYDRRVDPYPRADPATLLAGHTLPTSGTTLQPNDKRLDPYLRADPPIRLSGYTLPKAGTVLQQFDKRLDSYPRADPGSFWAGHMPVSVQAGSMLAPALQTAESVPSEFGFWSGYYLPAAGSVLQESDPRLDPSLLTSFSPALWTGHTSVLAAGTILQENDKRLDPYALPAIPASLWTGHVLPAAGSILQENDKRLDPWTVVPVPAPGLLAGYVLPAAGVVLAFAQRMDPLTLPVAALLVLSGPTQPVAGSVLSPSDRRLDLYPLPAELFPLLLAGYVLPASGSVLSPYDKRLDSNFAQGALLAGYVLPAAGSVLQELDKRDDPYPRAADPATILVGYVPLNTPGYMLPPAQRDDPWPFAQGSLLAGHVLPNAGTILQEIDKRSDPQAPPSSFAFFVGYVPLLTAGYMLPPAQREDPWSYAQGALLAGYTLPKAGAILQELDERLDPYAVTPSPAAAILAGHVLPQAGSVLLFAQKQDPWPFVQGNLLVGYVPAAGSILEPSDKRLDPGFSQGTFLSGYVLPKAGSILRPYDERVDPIAAAYGQLLVGYVPPKAGSAMQPWDKRLDPQALPSGFSFWVGYLVPIPPIPPIVGGGPFVGSWGGFLLDSRFLRTVEELESWLPGEPFASSFAGGVRMGPWRGGVGERDEPERARSEVPVVSWREDGDQDEDEDEDEDEEDEKDEKDEKEWDRGDPQEEEEVDESGERWALEFYGHLDALDREHAAGLREYRNGVWFRSNTFLQLGQVYQELVTGRYAVTWARPGLYPQPPRTRGNWAPRNLTGYVLTMTAKFQVEDSDGQAIFQIDSALIGGITVTNVVVGSFTATAPAVANSTFADGVTKVVYDVRVKDPADNVFTADEGFILVPPTVTRALT
jgi:hypothetical protein